MEYEEAVWEQLKTVRSRNTEIRDLQTQYMIVIFLRRKHKISKRKNDANGSWMWNGSQLQLMQRIRLEKSQVLNQQRGIVWDPPGHKT